MSVPRWKPSQTVALICASLLHLCSSVRVPEPEGGVWLWEHPDAFEEPTELQTAPQASLEQTDKVSLEQPGYAEAINHLGMGIPYGSPVSQPKASLVAGENNSDRLAAATTPTTTTVTVAVTALAAIAGKGTTRLVVRDEFGFHIGDRLQIGEDSHGIPLIREIRALNPILIDRPLEKAFPPGTVVKTYQEPPPTAASTTPIAPAPIVVHEDRNLTCVKPEEATTIIIAVIALGILTVILLCVVLGTWFCGWGREAAKFNCRVISEKKVGILSEPDITAEVIKYVEAGTIFGASLCAEPSDGRTYFLLQDKSGWVPECSRKDASRPVVTAQYVKTGKMKSRPSLESDGDDEGGKTL